MKNILILAFYFFFSHLCNAHSHSMGLSSDSTTYSYLPSKQYGRHLPQKIVGFGGVAFGRESFFALKCGFIAQQSLVKVRGWKRYDKFFYPISIYGGGELSMFGLFALWGSVGANAGLNLGPLTLDGTLTWSGITGEKTKYGMISYNPKIGLHFGPVWLKMGIHVPMKGVKMENMYNKLKMTMYNFEFVYCFEN